ncbi:PD-(D/E)XK nuclease family protein [Deinococcus antarcticus]|uniref:PD-(D/E)XK nuclease family protein n=1 Tax=Deinococcus antarcticus TaxID=1298767 RepID=A0ABV8A861_9DEIO
MTVRTIITHASPNLLRQRAREHLLQQGEDHSVVIPNLAAGRSLRQLTRTALPTITFAQLAQRQLFQAGWTPLSQAGKTQRLSELLTSLELEYFTPLLDRPGTLPALLDVIRALLRSDAAHLPAGRTPRERDLARMHRAWVLSLLRDAHYDPAVPEFFAARTALESRPLTVSGFAYLDAAQIAYLDRLAAEPSVVFLAAARADELSEAHRTLKALTGRGWDWQELDSWRHRADPRLTRTGDRAARHALALNTATPFTAEDVPVLTLPSVVEEVREVLRQVKLAHQFEGRPWHELAVVVRDEPGYLPALLDTAERYGIPLVCQARVPFLGTPLGSFLSAWLDAALSDWPFERTRDTLTHPLIHLPFEAQVRARGFGRRSPRGLQSWGEEAILRELEWPAQASGRAFLEHLTAVLKALGVLERQRSDAHIGVQLAVLRQTLSALDRPELYDRQVFLSEARALLGEAHLPALPQKTGVRVATPLSTLGRSYQRVWVLGLSEGQFPRPTPDLPLLDAHLRAHWSQAGVYLPGGVESQAIERALFFHALACAREGLTLTRPEVTAGGRPSEPSPFLRPFALPRPPEEFHAATSSEARVQLALGGQLQDEGVAALARQEEQRELGTHPGPLLPGLIDPQSWTWSASQLHAFGSCRFRWLAGRVMNLAPLPEPLLAPDPLTRGSLYHLTLEGLLRPYLDQDAPPGEVLVRELPAAFDTATRRLQATGEIETGPLWAAQRQDHLRVLSEVVSAPDFLPPGQQVKALEHKLAGTFTAGGHDWTFTGYADRVDEDAHGQQQITDYKLGRYISHVKDAAGKLSLEIQLPLYLKLTGAASGRYFSLNAASVLAGTGPAWTGGKTGWAEHAAQLETFLSGVNADIQAGDYRAVPDVDARACQYCDVQSLCRFQSFSTGEGT